MSDIAGLCDICGKVAKHKCHLCGKIVCDEHYDAVHKICARHTQNRATVKT
jgi:hypothetical protein